MITATLILCRGPMDPSTFELTNVDLNATQIVVTLQTLSTVTSAPDGNKALHPTTSIVLLPIVLTRRKGRGKYESTEEVTQTVGHRNCVSFLV